MVNLAELVKSIQALQKNLEIVNKKVEDLRKSFDAVEKFIKKLSGEELTIAYENFMHDQGQRPCDGVWDRKIGKCVIKVNTPPKANAGVDVKVNPNDQVRLTGTATDNENNIIKVKWSQLGGTPVDLVPTSDGYGATFIAPSVAGDLEFEFYVEDDAHLNDRDQVIVKVESVPVDPILNVVAPSSIEVLNSAVIDASSSVADTVETKETTSKNVQLTEVSKWKWQFYAPDSPSSYNLGFESKAVKGNKQSIKQTNISVTKSGGGGGEIDSYGIKWLVAKGQQSLITMSRDEATDDRWSANIDNLESGFEATFIGKSIGTNNSSHFAMKQGGSNHSKGNWQDERWLDTGLRYNGEVQLQYEGPHPNNHDFTLPSTKQFIKNIGKGLEGNWIGLKWCQQILKPGGSPANGGVRWRMWVDRDAINASGKPNNNWELVYDFIDGVDAQVIQPQTFVMQGTMDAEVRRSDTDQHDVFGDGKVYTDAQDGTPGLHIRALGGAATEIKKAKLSAGHKKK